MSSIIAAVAAEVARQVNLATLPRPLPTPALRRWAPSHRTEELADLRVVVVPGAVETGQIGRTRDNWDCEMLIAVQQAMPDGSDNADELVAIVEAIANHFAAQPRHQLVTIAGIAHLVVPPSIKPAMDPQHYRENGIFTGVVRITYRVFRTTQAAP